MICFFKHYILSPSFNKSYKRYTGTLRKDNIIIYVQIKQKGQSTSSHSLDAAILS